MISPQCVIYILLLKNLMWKFQLQKPKLWPFKEKNTSEVKFVSKT
jgi:hypothetical protein